MKRTDPVTPQLLTRSLLDTLLQTAGDAPRKRSHQNLHPTLEDPVQRFFNGMQPGTYVRPHRHLTPPGWELFLVLRGRLALLTFDDQGRVSGRHELQAGGPVFGIELPEQQWHTVVALEPSVMFELKPGPYSPMTDKDFAPWAPEEGHPQCTTFVQWFGAAGVGDTAPAFSNP